MHEPGDDEVWNLYLRIAPKQYIEIQPVKAPNPHPHPDSAKYYDNQTLWHFSLETDDLGMVIDHLRSQGIRMTQFAEPDSKEVLSLNDAIYSIDGCFICWVRDPDGTPIELMERTKHSMQTRAEKRISGNFLP
ncbi:MAG: VOC family protein [Oscillospiraceae bacterium]|nr:VOC family protein [Oscillospiraceae bacterium]